MHIYIHVYIHIGNGSDVDITPMDLNMAIPPLRLHDTYQNAFQKG
jgi:hypothetical protein